jgi:hypothetical protein
MPATSRTRPRTASQPRTQAKDELPEAHPTAMAFLDEAGFIARDRFFAVGCLKLLEPSVLLRKVRKLRDRTQKYHEIHFKDLTKDSLPFYRSVVDLVAASDGYFSCFVADRDQNDPVARFGSHWLAYEKLAKQLLLGTIRPRELLVVLADNYSTPDHVVFEQDVRAAVNKQLGRLARERLSFGLSVNRRSPDCRSADFGGGLRVPTGGGDVRAEQCQGKLGGARPEQVWRGNLPQGVQEGAPECRSLWGSPAEKTGYSPHAEHQGCPPFLAR